jgi:hypothetical protein
MTKRWSKNGSTAGFVNKTNARFLTFFVDETVMKAWIFLNRLCLP